MFRISFMTDDKKLAKALTALDGLAFNLEVTPAHVGAKPNGTGRGHRIDYDEWVKKLPKTLTWSNVKATLQADGRGASTSSVITLLQKKKLIKRVGKVPGKYERIG